MTGPLNRVFFIQVLLFGISIFMVLLAVFSFITVGNVKKSLIQEFKSNLQITANDISHKVLIAEENVKAVSSRSMMKTKLFDYHNGTFSLEQVREYSQPKFEEGVEVYNNLLYAARTDLNGTVISEYKPEYRGAETEEEGSPVFFDTEQGCNVLIRNIIVHNQTEIGVDEAAFYMNGFPGNNFKILQELSIKKDFIHDKRIKNYSFSFPVESTGFYLYAELNQNMLRNAQLSEIRIVLIESFLLLAVVIVISYFTILRLALGLNEKLQESNRSLNDALKTKDLLFDELHHRIKNNLAFITSYISLQQSWTDDKEIIHRNDQLINKLNAISIAYEMLRSGKEISSLFLGEYLYKLCRTVVDSSHVHGIRIESGRMDQVSMNSKTVITIGLLFSELVINSIKHAKNEEDLTITIGIKSNKDSVELSYEDDGKAFPGDMSIKGSGSFGMMIISSLAEQIHASVEYDFMRSKIIKFIVPV